MINLAGQKQADEFIQEELILADIPMVRGIESKGEVPYSILGNLNGWEFTRAWYYWVAKAKGNNGIPLVVATQLHERRYPIIGENQPQTYGKVVRVAGHCGSPHPREWAFPAKDELRRELERLEKDGATFGEIADLCNSGVIRGERFIDNYHIDGQLGLRELANVIRNI